MAAARARKSGSKSEGAGERAGRGRGKGVAQRSPGKRAARGSAAASSGAAGAGGARTGPSPAASQLRRHGQPVAEDVRRHALRLLASGVRPKVVSESVGVTTECLRLWRRAAERRGEMATASTPGATKSAPRAARGQRVPRAGEVQPDLPQLVGVPAAPAAPAIPAPSTNPVHAATAPHDPGQGLGEREVAAILETKQRSPSMGPAQIRAQLKRFHGWRVSIRAIARVLKGAGYELVHVASRPRGEEEPRRWEAARRNAVWQADFVEMRVGPERASLLLVQDDHSRFVVAHELMEAPTSEAVVEVLRRAILRHGRPETFYTDRGGPFVAWRRTSSLASFLEAELIDHAVSPAYRPQGRGKVENLAGTVRRELWDVEHFESLDAARGALARFFDRFNHRRAHMGLDGLVPADRYFGRADEVMARMQAASRRRQGALVQGGAADPFVSEETGPEVPCEVLRLVVLEGRMELRMMGHRVDLGPLRP